MRPDVEALLLRAAKEDAGMSESELRADRRSRTIAFVQRATGYRAADVAALYDQTMDAGLCVQYKPAGSGDR